MKIRKTKKIDRRGLIRIGRRFGIAPVFVANLQQDKIVELPDDKALALIERGYAIRAQHRADDPITVDDTDIATTEDPVGYKGANYLDEDDEDEDEDEVGHEEEDQTEEEPTRDVEL